MNEKCRLPARRLCEPGSATFRPPYIRTASRQNRPCHAGRSFSFTVRLLQSDIDIMVEFEPETRVGMIRFETLAEERTVLDAMECSPA